MHKWNSASDLRDSHDQFRDGQYWLNVASLEAGFLQEVEKSQFGLDISRNCMAKFGPCDTRPYLILEIDFVGKFVCFNVVLVLFFRWISG